MRLSGDLRKPIILFGVIIAFMAVLVCVSILQKKETKQQQDEAVDSQAMVTDTQQMPDEETVLEETGQTGKLDPDGITLSYDGSMSKDYLQSCIFLGDSRIVGMALYGYIDTNTALAQIGLNHNNAMDITYSTSTGEIYTFDSYLVTHPSKVIYICSGVNGLTQNESRFKADYQELVEHVKYLCPDSNVVIQSIWPSRDDGMYTATVSNEKIDYYNEYLYDLAAEEDCYYLDIQGALKDEEGQMMKQYDSGDGLHYNQNGYTDIIAYIVSHPVPGVTPEPNGFKKETFVWKNTTGNGAIDSSSVQSNSTDISVSANQSAETVSDNYAEDNFVFDESVSENGDFQNPEEWYSEQEVMTSGQDAEKQNLNESDIPERERKQDNTSEDGQEQGASQDTSKESQEQGGGSQDTSKGSQEQDFSENTGLEQNSSKDDTSKGTTEGQEVAGSEEYKEQMENFDTEELTGGNGILESELQNE